jgi:dimethylglycine dehydrogenase
MHRRWFESHLGKFNVNYNNRSDEFHGLSIAGPNSRKVLEKIVREDISNEKFKFRDSRRMFVGGVPAIVNRISFTGELGYEIYVAPHYQIKLYEELTQAGKEFSIKPFGGRALMSMRLEKNWGAWTLDYRPDFTAKETGLDTFINWNKEFIGKENAQKDNSTNKIVPLIVETNEIDVTNNEAVVNGNDSIGYVTSGGFAHYVNKSVAFTFLDQNKINHDNKIQIEINGDLFNCSLIKDSLYDPTGQKMRS